MNKHGRTAGGSPYTRSASVPRVFRTTCPTCRAAVKTRDVSGNSFFPFCSRRCKLIDLGKWFDGQYRLSRPADEGLDQ